MIDNKLGENRIAVGIVLCICGVSLGGLLKLALGVNISWLSTVIILISLIFRPPYSWSAPLTRISVSAHWSPVSAA